LKRSNRRDAENAKKVKGYEPGIEFCLYLLISVFVFLGVFAVHGFKGSNRRDAENAEKVKGYRPGIEFCLYLLIPVFVFLGVLCVSAV
jgi:hypothetical protein